MNKSILFISFFASIANAETVSLSCEDPDLNSFKYYFVKLNTTKMTAERTMSYVYGGLDGLARGFNYQNEQQKKVLLRTPKSSNLKDNFYQINHNLSFSNKVVINRKNPANSMVWIDAVWWEFNCELIPEEIINLKIEQLNKEKADRKAKNKF